MVFVAKGVGRSLTVLAALAGALLACQTILAAPTPTPITVDPGPPECQDRVTVVVWGDQDGDGVQDADEPPLADVLLLIRSKDDPTGPGSEATTFADGRAHFPVRSLEGCQLYGHMVLFPRQVSGYQFPAQPLVSLDDSVPNQDVIGFGLLPLDQGSPE